MLTFAVVPFIKERVSIKVKLLAINVIIGDDHILQIVVVYSIKQGILRLIKVHWNLRLVLYLLDDEAHK